MKVLLDGVAVNEPAGDADKGGREDADCDEGGEGDGAQAGVGGVGGVHVGRGFWGFSENVIWYLDGAWVCWTCL